MLIDFHTHAFDEKIADKAIEKLESVAKMTAFTRGRIEQTIERMDEWGVDYSVLLPVVTKPSQQNTVNNWAKAMTEAHPRIFAYGSVHPEAEDVFEEIERIKALGLKGVKFHPDYQDFFIGEERMFPIYRKCADVGLPVIFHGGWDPLSPDVIHAIPEDSLKAHRAVPEMTMILAHLGGMTLWDDVEKYIAGEDIYLDTAVISTAITPVQCERIIKNHGSEKILFGSDSPWDSAENELNLLKNCHLTEEEFENITHKNAEKLLGI